MSKAIKGGAAAPLSIDVFNLVLTSLSASGTRFVVVALFFLDGGSDEAGSSL